jgi:hypothetical protein
MRRQFRYFFFDLLFFPFRLLSSSTIYCGKKKEKGGGGEMKERKKEKEKEKEKRSINM